MSRKHDQRTRAQILAKRAQQIAEIRVQKKTLLPNGQTMYVPQTTSSERLKTAFDASKYMPHSGVKERERAKRCYMVSAFVGGPERSAPVMMQMSKRQYEEPAYYPTDAQWSEYESAF